jgi:uncharacterized protein
MIDWKKEWKPLAVIVAIFSFAYFLPIGMPRFDHAIQESLHLIKWYAREHVMLCLVPAFFIAGAISVFVRQEAVMKYLGAKANKVLAYGVASVSGTILAVCSCTVLPLFNGIYRMGAGLGPATAFLYSGPAINVLAIILTARILGVELGIARAVGAIVFSIVIGLAMHFIFIKEETERSDAQMNLPETEVERPLWQNIVYFGVMVGILVFANWGKPQGDTGIWAFIFNYKWLITIVFSGLLGFILMLWFSFKWWKMVFVAVPTIAVGIVWGATSPIIPFTIAVLLFSYFVSTDKGQTGEWFSSTWGFAKQILPLLFIGVIIAGLLLGRPDQEGLIPSAWVHMAVGGNSIRANLFASVAGAFMYFATLTEVPILQGLIGAGMGKGPALALLLAGPALSLPNMLVIRSVIGTKKTIVFVSLVVIMATISGIIFGALF